MNSKYMSPPTLLPTTSLPVPLISTTSTNNSTTTPATIAMSHRIAYSGISGAIATTVIYPLDIVKTKVQNASNPNVTPITVTKEIYSKGWSGFYRGWPPNVLLVMPEKAIKITANDQFRDLIRNMRSAKDLPLYCEMIAGGSAGLCQVIMTNPMELLKIQGATMEEKITTGQLKSKIPYTTLIRQLGISGLYTGVFATLIRDIPFSMIYFPAFAQLKAHFAHGDTNFSFKQSLAAGAIAGTIAAATTCPMDVIKTRVHANATPMKLPLSEFLRREVSNIPHHYRNVIREGGFGALFRGVVPRCIIITPLFAITMGCYDLFQSRLG